MSAYHEEELEASADLSDHQWHERFEYVGNDPDDGLPLWRPRRGLIDLDDGPYDGPGDRLYE